MKKGRDPRLEFEAVLIHKGISRRSISLFRKMIYGHYLKEGRQLPWRKTRNPYRILASEIMLQRTQVARTR